VAVIYPVTTTAVGTAVGAGAAAAGPVTGAVVVVVAAVTVIESGWEAVVAPVNESVTVAVKLKVPTVVHVPVIAPVEALRLSAGGSEPLLIDHV
jgi:hypothetical protein